MTHTGLMAFHIAQFLKAQKFKAYDTHYYHSGAQVDVIDPFNGQKYRVMVEPIYENKRAAIPLNSQGSSTQGETYAESNQT